MQDSASSDHLSSEKEASLAKTRPCIFTNMLKSPPIIASQRRPPPPFLSAPNQKANQRVCVSITASLSRMSKKWEGFKACPDSARWSILFLRGVICARPHAKVVLKLSREFESWLNIKGIILSGTGWSSCDRPVGIAMDQSYTKRPIRVQFSAGK